MGLLCWRWQKGRENFASMKAYVMHGPEERKAFSRRTEDLLYEGVEGTQESSVCG